MVSELLKWRFTRTVERKKNIKKAFYIKKKSPPGLTNQERREVVSTYLIAS